MDFAWAYHTCRHYLGTDGSVVDLEDMLCCILQGGCRRLRIIGIFIARTQAHNDWTGPTKVVQYPELPVCATSASCVCFFAYFLSLHIVLSRLMVTLSLHGYLNELLPDQMSVSTMWTETLPFLLPLSLTS